MLLIFSWSIIWKNIMISSQKVFNSDLIDFDVNYNILASNSIKSGDKQSSKKIIKFLLVRDIWECLILIED